MGVYIGLVFAAPPLETTDRPAGGLARGVWEGPPWFFYALAAAVVVVTALYFVQRAGLLRRGARGTKR